MSNSNGFAPGWPGLRRVGPRGVGRTVSRSSRVWYSLSHGILNKIYFPHVDAACTRDLGVTDGTGLFFEEKRDCGFEVTPVEFGIPTYHPVFRIFGSLGQRNPNRTRASAFGLMMCEAGSNPRPGGR